MTAERGAGAAGAGPGSLFAGYVFDLDGTVYLGDEPLPGAVRVLARLRELGRRVVFVSNHPTRDPAHELTPKTGEVPVNGETVPSRLRASPK